MKTWKEFLEAKENMNEIFGFSKKNPRRTGQFAKAYEVLLKKHNNDEEQANLEFDELVKTPNGQYQLYKMMSNLEPNTSGTEDQKYQQFKAKNLSGPDMFK